MILYFVVPLLQLEVT